MTSREAGETKMRLYFFDLTGRGLICLDIPQSFDVTNQTIP